MFTWGLVVGGTLQGLVGRKRGAGRSWVPASSPFHGVRGRGTDLQRQVVREWGAVARKQRQGVLTIRFQDIGPEVQQVLGQLDLSVSSPH